MANKMSEVREKYVQPVKEYWDGMEPVKRKRLGIVAAVLLVAIIALVAVLNYNPYVVLYKDLDSSEASLILSSLQDKGISAKVENNGTIMVPKDQEAALKMQLATEGYPKSGFSYDIYMDNVDTMVTDSDRRTYRLFQLQNRMQEAIKTINGVKEAVVTITLPDNGNYVLNSNKDEPSASVVVTLVGVEDFTKGQVNGIKRLVSTGVLGLKTENVAVINSNTGKEMGSDSADLSSEATERLSIEKQIDDKIEEKVGAILAAIVGEDQYKVIATSRVNSDDVLQQSKSYAPSDEEANRGIPSEENHYLESGDEAILQYGVPGAETNADVTTYPELENGEGENGFINKYDLKYYVNESKEEVKRQDVVIESITVSVVITNQDIPLSERDNLTELLAKAASVPVEDVVIYFADRQQDTNVAGLDIEDWLTQYRWVILGIAVALLILIIILVVLIKRRKRRREEEAARLEQELIDARLAAQKALEPEKIQVVEETPQQKLIGQVKGFADEHPDVAAQLIRSWLKGDE